MNDKDEFEKTVAKKNNRSYGVICHNPNYVALVSAMSGKNKKRLQAGQEVVLSTVGTTLQDVLQLGLVPVFVDIDLPTYNANPCIVEEAVNENTGAIFLQHTLGNPIAIQYLSDNILEGSYIWGVFDCSASIGGTCTGTYDGQPVGNFGDLSTFTFKKTGVVLTDSIHLEEILRNNCRSCSVEPIPNNIKVHRENWDYYHKAFEGDEYFILPEPHHMADPNWQGFCLTCRGDRKKLLQYLETKGIPTHLLPVQNYHGYQLIGTDKNTKTVKDKSFWIDIGVRPEQKEYVVDAIKKGCKV
jgi:CDP-6-deoxy-D-xylo-4-hexulose-3-dehydrase